MSETTPEPAAAPSVEEPPAENPDATPAEEEGPQDAETALEPE